jgi:hypothetical protein
VLSGHKRIRNVFSGHEAFGLQNFARKVPLLKSFYETVF